MIPFEYLALAIVFTLLTVGFLIKNEWLVALSGMGLMVLGLYIAINGAGSLNDWMTLLMGFIFIGLGAMTFIVPILEIINENM